MQKTLSDSLQNIVKGTAIIFIGVFISLMLNFIIRIILVRSTTQDEYGIYTLAITLVTMTSTLSMLGLDEGAARFIAYFTGKSDNSNVKDIIYTSIKLVLITSIASTMIFFIFSEFISVQVFHSPELSNILKIASITVPFMVLTGMLLSIMRGFNIPRAKVIFNDILKPLLFLVFLIAAILLNMGFETIIYAYALSVIITLFAFLAYIKRVYSNKYSELSRTEKTITGELLKFSIPLLSVNVLLMMMSQATTLILGHFKTPSIVGEFDIALLMAGLLLIVLNSIGYMYTPIISNLFGKDRIEELKRSYIITTKWGYMSSLPIFFVFLLFPETIVNLLFGARYIGIAFVLQIVVIGYIINPITGPNYHTLIAMGRTRFIIESFLMNAILNIVFSILLIPPLGIIGAAIAVTFSASVANILLSVRLYQILKIHPFTRNYIVSIAISFILVPVFYLLMKFLAIEPSIFIAIMAFVLYATSYVALMIVFKAIDNEDVMILSEIERRIGKYVPILRRKEVIK
ncbi:hypothetical protein CUJ83_07650 [Methanocella sp. CWC-04]|uniref:Membrane protein involved in the export of O-antigen and teichoic acid n=1 Tax=Methanooceanicella nereidis TaxID=2052831 RepID=A0AAP2RC74_9EURY|nr:flippase [Methanocella sp. CWC-04]MCD1294871.1 hypothetical protein [Methanocella sp. CWC-04]